MTTGITCTLWADGQRVADGSPGDDPLEPNALSGLRIGWGRSTTVDQPESSTCTVDLLDAPGGSAFVDLLRTGMPVDVTASGTVYPDPTQSTFPDPSFEAGPPGLVATNAVATLSTARPRTGARSLELVPVDGTRRMTAVIAPDVFVPAGTRPDAWDHIPTTSPGQTWSVGAWLNLPPGSRVELRPVMWAGPYQGTGILVDQVVAAADGPADVDADGWVHLAGQFVPQHPDRWIGLQVSVYPTGLRWVDADPQLRWVDADPAVSWDDHRTVYVDDIEVLAPAEGTTSTVLVFSGRITSLEARYDDELDAPVLTVAASDFLADLDNRDVGDEPWLVEPMAVRFGRILTLSGLPITSIIDPTVAGVEVSWRDVDRQGAAGLLTELATTVDAVLWSATHQVSGPYLHVEDVSQRPPLYRLEMGSDGVVRIVVDPDAADALELSACDVLRDDVRWTQSVEDVTTRAAVSWLEQGVDDDGQPATTERTVTVVDADLEAEYGTRRYSVSTQLVDGTDAQRIADQILGRLSVVGYRADGLVIQDEYLTGSDVDDVHRLLTLLDGTSRNGLPIRLVDLPEWTPGAASSALYLEGGQYTFENGHWVLELTVSSAAAVGQSAAWADMNPAWRWVDVDPEISWADLAGVGPSNTLGGTP